MAKLPFALFIPVLIAATATLRSAGRAPDEAEDDAEPVAILAEVHGLALEPETNTPVVLLTTLDKSRYLPIFVGEAEAAAIWRYLNHKTTPRPMTHDLLLDIMSKLGGELRKVTVTELKKGVFYATIEIAIRREANPATGTADPEVEQIVTVDARPSDSIALALKMGTKVYVASKVFDEAGQPGKAPPKEIEAPVGPAEPI
jgi:bifunctional DNase/RNase